MPKPLTRDDAEFQIFLESKWHLVFFRSSGPHLRPTVGVYYLLDTNHLTPDLTHGKGLEFNADVIVLVGEDGVLRASKNRYGALDGINPKIMAVLEHDYAVREVHES